MKPYQKAIIGIIIILALINYVPLLLTYTKHNSKVKPNQVWVTYTKILYFMNNSETGNLTISSYKKVIKVDLEKDSVYYYCSKSDDFSECSTIYSDDIDSFTFNSEGWRTTLLE